MQTNASRGSVFGAVAPESGRGATGEPGLLQQWGLPAHFFLALDAAFTSRTASDDLEEQELLLLSEAELRQALLAGEFKLLPWVAIVGLALQYLQTS